MKGRKFADDKEIVYMANFWLAETRIQNSSTTESKLWRNAGLTALIDRYKNVMQIFFG